MAFVTIRGKEKLYDRFSKLGHPYWRLYEQSAPRTVIGENITEDNISDAFRDFQSFIDVLEPQNTYILETFSIEDKKFTKPATTVTFSLMEAQSPAELAGMKNKKEIVPFEAASMKETLDLIKKNAALQVEISQYKSMCEQKDKEILELKAEIEELEEIVEEYEEEEEEAMAGTGDPIKNALAKLIEDNGGVVLENIFSKGVKDPLNDNPEEPKISGITETQLPELDFIIRELSVKDKNLHGHLYKLLLIAQQKPATFNMFLKKLEGF